MGEIEITKIGRKNLKKERPCPVCGESRFFNIDENTRKCYGIAGGVEQVETTGFFNLKFHHYTCFTCYTCGSEWREKID